METVISMEAIWNFLRSLSLSKANREWLAEKLLNANDSSDQSSKIVSEYNSYFAPKTAAERLASTVQKIEDGSYAGLSFDEFEHEISEKFPWLEK